MKEIQTSTRSKLVKVDNFQVELSDHGWASEDEREREGNESDEKYANESTHGWWSLP